VLKSVFELQPLFVVAVTKEFKDDLCSMNMPFYQALKYAWKINYTLGNGKIHGKQNKPSFNFVQPFIGKL